MAKRHFDYVRAATCAEAAALLAGAHGSARPLAGGTDLMVVVHKEGPQWDLLVDVSRIAEMRSLRHEGDSFFVGAGVTHAEAWENEEIRRFLPLLSTACHAIGSPQIRNRGTIGGNVANAAACADTMPALVCLGAVALIVTPEGQTEMPVGEVVLGPGRTALPAASVIREFRIPTPAAGSHMSFFKVGRRQAQAISRLSLACLGRLDEAGRVEEVRLSPGACTAQTQRFDDAEAVLLGRRPTIALAQEAGRAAAAQMVALAGRRWSTDYKEPVLAVLVERALKQAFDLGE